MTEEFRGMLIWVLVIIVWLVALILWLPSFGWSTRIAGKIGEWFGDKNLIIYSHGHGIDQSGML